MSAEHTFIEEGISAFSVSNEEAIQGRLRPVTVRQILSAMQAHSRAKFRIDNSEVVNVSLVAHVVFIDTSQDKWNVFHLEDSGPGRLVAQQWDADIPGTEEDESGVSDIKPGSYARIIGLITQYGGKNRLRVRFIRPVADPHEVWCHILDSMLVTLQVRQASSQGNFGRFYTSQSSEQSGRSEELEQTAEETGSVGTPCPSTAEVHLSPFDGQRTPTSPRPSSPRAEAPLPEEPPSHSHGDVSDSIDMADDPDTSAPPMDDSVPVSDWDPTVSTGSTSTMVSRDGGGEMISSDARVDERISRVESLSLWDDAEPFTSTPAPHQAGAPSHGQANVLKEESSRTALARRAPALTPDPYQHLPNLHRAIMVLMHEAESQTHQGTDGVKRERIIRGMKFKDPSVTTEQVEDALELLLDDARLYTTINDRHYKVAY